MHKTSRLLLGSILAVVLMAPPASAQNTNERLNTLDRDVLDVKGAVKSMQDTFDQRNSEVKSLLDQILARFAAIDDGMKRLNDSLGTIKTADEVSARELREARESISSIRTSIDNINKLNLGETLNNMNTSMGSMQRDIANLKTVETPLPGAKEAFESASTNYSQGIWALAIPELREFVQAYPKDPRAPYAQVMLGTALLENRQPEKAIVEFDFALQNYPDSDKKCLALFKKGLAHTQTNDKPQAREVFTLVGKEKACAGSEEAAAAAAELKKLQATPARGARGTN